MEFSLFYFAAEATEDSGQELYRLLLDGARFAEERGFRAVWTPERHFHPFGGVYPNPSVTGAAIAAITERVGIRAGSVVAPLHSPLRVAEEWAVVDRLSGGRVGVSFASGWHPSDFALNPGEYYERRHSTLGTVEAVRRLWRGEALTLPDGEGRPVELTVYPRPAQAELPVWLTSTGTTETFEAAGRIGAGVLTHLVRQDVDRLTRNIAAYRRALGPDRTGHVTLMVHTLLGADREAVREVVRPLLTEYLSTSLTLVGGANGAQGARVPMDRVSASAKAALLARSVDRYVETAGLFGTVADAVPLVERLAAAGVDEIAALIDFGVPLDDALAGLDDLDRLRKETVRVRASA
ncbi:MupA/Atu3671 family FMN-dependent luciferase-like monooxygenase [Streptomyces sp. NPDC002586]